MPYQCRKCRLIHLWGPKFTYFCQSCREKFLRFRISYTSENLPKVRFLVPLYDVSIRKYNGSRNNAVSVPKCRLIYLWGPKFPFFRLSYWKKLSMFRIAYGHENAPELTYSYPLRYVGIRKCNRYRNNAVKMPTCRHVRTILQGMII